MAAFHKQFSTVLTRIIRSKIFWLLVVVCGSQSGCYEKAGLPIHVIVPDGFRGLVRIVEDKAGMEVPIEGGEFVYRIPTNGVLIVNQADGFGEWHQDRASYASGAAVQMLSMNMTPSPASAIALFVLDRSHNQVRLFLGTQEGMVAFLKSPAGI